MPRASPHRSSLILILQAVKPLQVVFQVALVRDGVSNSPAGPKLCLQLGREKVEVLVVKEPSDARDGAAPCVALCSLKLSLDKENDVSSLETVD